MFFREAAGTTTFFVVSLDVPEDDDLITGLLTALEALTGF